MTDPLQAIMAGIAALLTGTAGHEEREIPDRRFRHEKQDVELMPARGLAKRPRAFNVRNPRMVEPEDAVSSWTTASHMERTSELELAVAYADTNVDVFSLEQEIATDMAEIFRVLEWTENWALTTGWTGCKVLGSTIVPIADIEGNSALLVNSILVRVDHREDRQ
jgi:hypothetical protein